MSLAKLFSPLKLLFQIIFSKSNRSKSKFTEATTRGVQ